MSSMAEPLYKVALLVLYFEYNFYGRAEFLEENQIWTPGVENWHILLISWNWSNVCPLNRAPQKGWGREDEALGEFGKEYVCFALLLLIYLFTAKN